MIAYVLAAGYATRMYPLTRDFPKPLLEVGGVPILSHLMRRLRSLDGLTDIVLVTNSRFYGRFRDWAEAAEPWARITVLDDGTTSNEDRRGALGDLRFALECVPLGGDDAIVLASDYLFDADLAEVQRSFQEWRAPTMLVRRVDPPEGPSPYNEVTLDDRGRVVRMREKPVAPKSDLSAIALYFLTAGDLALLDEYLQEGSPDAPGHFLAWLVDRQTCYAAPLSGRWFDIGSIEGYEEAKRRFAEGDPYR
jgi:glucose-1-phosphate thymidylyltransferase